MNSDHINQEKLALLNQLSQGNYKAFLYDCDGTLADNMHAHKAAFVKVAADHQIQLNDTIIDELAGWPTILVAEEISRRYNVSFNAIDFSKLKSQVFIEEFIADTKPVQFVVDHLKAHVGKIKIGVVSGGSRSTVTKTLSVIGIDSMIDVLVCAGDTPKGKPYPDPFLLAAEKLGVRPEECLVFEDGDPGVQAADAAGMKWIRVDKIAC
ncbi:MAG: HAD family hydrolase [Flavisolibacter sp.]